ncbi:hypothetical protein GCM10010193_10030 [Kitasatospora atroaurantiaca]|uniref:PKD repeat protein n=1 Tax=Kitasatospora atroaurantiaca TaxID=285545 RepID=A0A561ES62_9ACTN|nr:PKD domain-containing protein [Kitasatospora atroaurantiaca]TWE18452.1 PKD repeat protein [Kitasatospora atroaurantiaca]
MRLRHFAGLATATTVVLGAVLPLPTASAAEGDTLYVNPNLPCSTGGGGTAEHPYCRIQDAVDAAKPGQTVYVARWTQAYPEAVQVRSSGTTDKPITITTGAWTEQSDETTAQIEAGSAPAFSFRNGVHDVIVRNFGIGLGGQTARVVDSPRITIDHVAQFFSPSSYQRGAVEVSGGSDDFRLTRSAINSAEAAVLVEGSSRAVISTNDISSAKVAVATDNAPYTAVTNNTLQQECHTVVRLTGDAVGSQIHNNVITTTGTTGEGCTDPLITIEQGNGAEYVATNLTHNLLHSAGGAVPYLWGDKTFETPEKLAEFIAPFLSPEQGPPSGTADLLGDPQLAEDGYSYDGLGTTSPAIDSADAKAIGTLDTDLNGHPIVDDPQVADAASGSGHRDRGAFELQSLGLLAPAVNGGPGPYPLKVTVTAKPARQNWPTKVSYSVDFGDGTAPVASATPSAEHVYQKSGKFTVTLTQTDQDGHAYSFQGNRLAVVNEPGLPSVAFTATPCTTSRSTDCLKPLSYVIDTTGSTSPWPITDYAVDYGDGSPVSHTPAVPHVYRAAGDYTVKVTATDAGGQTGTLTKTVGIGYRPSLFSGYSPTRVADTRTGSHPAKIGPGGKLTLKVGNGGVPAGAAASAVVLNVTAVAPTGGGFLAVAPGGTDRPTSSNINYTAGGIVPNLVTVPVGSDGTVNVWNGHTGASVDVVVDSLGEYNPEYGHQYSPLAPARLMDTRYGIGVPKGKISSACATKLQIRGKAGVPAGASSAVLNVTVTEPDRDGFLTVGHTMSSSNLNFRAGQTVANQVTAPIDADGTVTICNTGGAIHVVADVFGYYAADGGSLFTPVPPKRLTDTRSDGTGAIAGGAFHAVASGAPAGATGAVLNVTSAGSDRGGYLTVWADGRQRPGTSSVNFAAGQIVPNHVTTPLGANGQFDVYNFQGTTDVIADLFGYFTKPQP